MSTKEATKAKSSAATMDEAYRAAHHDAILIDHPGLNLLRFTGETRLDLINRMSTQKVVNLISGQGAATILTSDIGRIIDRILLYAFSDDVHCLTGEHNGENIARYLMRFVFFMDDFQIEDLSERTAVFGVYGKRSKERLAAYFDKDLDLPIHYWTETRINDLTVTIHRTDPITGDSYFIMGDSAERDVLQQSLLDAELTPVDEEAFEYLRIEGGRPRLGRELTQDYIPLEAGLWDDVSFNKGCYTGQEIIARMESRGRLAKKLALIQLESPVEPGTKITSKGKSVGTITSAADGPAGVRALGYVKTSALDEGSSFRAGPVPIIDIRPSF